ncbi:hypothetical protein DA803_01730 [[Mycoplasma] phocae]|uniref:Uncharacterized protein n=1 Tax=[Mycoplasma] phocae TaxID=142651 RepID=A0A2Z5IQM7_9BACT|nr:hypothetical protein [[Mycoplasma] phocae]AXE60804.1 hypothetical protein DA803_01730 [[Mycoplasma] phocae]
MKKNSKLNKTIIGISAFIVLGSSGIIAASCNNSKKINNQIDSNKNESQKILSGEIKYLAIGDDYAAGNNYSKNNFVINGLDEINNQINGLSYASYLANAIKDLNDKKTSLTSYYNYGLSGSKLDDWLHILNASKYPINSEIENNLDYNRNLMNGANSSRFHEQFGDFDEQAFNKIKNSIKEANLLTISIGFNDFFNDVTLFNNLFEITNGANNYENLEQKLKSWSENLAVKASSISQKYDQLIKEILNINPNIHISLVGYISPYLKLANILKKQFNGKDYIYEAVKQLNSLIKKVAKNNQINFTSFRDEESIISNPDKFSLDIFDMLPSLIAYKKLAQDIFMKLALDSFKYNELIGKITKDSDSSSYNQTILFNKNAEEIKQTILGVTGDNVDNFITKKYRFEEESQNVDVLKSQFSERNANPFVILKAKFNNGKGLNAEKTISYFELAIKLLGIDLSELKSSFTELKKDLENEENRQIFTDFINQILSSKTLQKNISEVKRKINELIEKKSYENLDAQDITNTFKEIFLSSNSIYAFFQELSQTSFIQNPIIKEKFGVYVQTVIEDLFASNLLKSFLPTEILENFEAIFDNKEFQNSVKDLLNSFVKNLISEPNKYNSAKNYVEFINLLLKNSSSEIKKFITTIISGLKNNEKLSNILISKISEKIQITYKLDAAQQKQVKKFIRIFLLNLNDFKHTDKLVNFVLQNLIDLQNESPEKRTIDKFFDNFFISILIDQYDLNKKHDLLFSLISANLGQTNEEQEDFRKGFEIFSLAYLKQRNLFDSKNLGKLISEKNRKNVLSLLINLIKNENQELSEKGKHFIANIITVLFENEIQNPDSNLNALLKQLGEIFIVNPIAAGLKTAFGDNAKISNESIENFVRKTWDKLWVKIKSKENIESIKNLISLLLVRSNEYNTDSIYAFVASALKDSKNNGIISLVDKFFKNIINSKDVSENIINGSLSLLEQGVEIKFNKEQKQLISSYFTNLLANIPQSKLYAFTKAKLENVLENIDIKKQTNFEDLNNYIKLQMQELLSLQNNSFLQEIIDVLFIKDGNGQTKMPFSEIIKAFSIILDNDKIIDFVIQKSNLKVIISNLLTTAKLPNNLSEDIKTNILKIFKSFNVFIKDKFDAAILPIIKRSLKSFFELNNKKVYNSLDEILKDFISQNKTMLKSEINNLLKDLLTADENGDLSLSSAKLISTFISENIAKFEWSKARASVENVIAKLIKEFPNFNLSNIVLDNIFSNLEENLDSNHFDINKYKFKIDVIEVINKIDYDVLVKFIKGISSHDAKNIAIVILKNLKNILKLSNNELSSNLNSKLVNNLDSKIKFDTTGKINISLSKWLEIFKSAFSAISEEKDKDEVKQTLKESITELFENANVKSFIKSKLNPLINKINQNSSLSNKIIGKILEISINNFLDNNENKELIISVGNWFIDLNEDTLKNINSFDDLIKQFLNSNQAIVIKTLKNIINDQISNDSKVDDLSDFILKLISNQYDISTTNIQDSDIKLVLSGILKGITSENIINDVFDKLFEIFKNINLFENDVFDQNKVISQIKEQLKVIDITKFLSKDKIKSLLESILKTENNIGSKQLIAFYQYLMEIIPKLNISSSKNSAVEVEEQQAKNEILSKEKIENIIINFVNALNEVLKNNKDNSAKHTITEVIVEIIKDQVKRVDFNTFNNEFISNDNIKSIFVKISEYDEIKQFFNDLIEDFTKYSGDKNNLGEIISSLLNSSRENITKNFTSLISKISKDESIKSLLIDALFKYLKLENTNNDDKQFISELIKDFIVKLQNHDFYKKKIINNLFDKLIKNAISFDILNPGQWIKESINQFISIISLNDLVALGDLIGENNIINGERIVKLINLILGKSNNPDSVFYKLLSNINTGENKTNMNDLYSFISSSKKEEKKEVEDPNDVKFSIDPLVVLDTIFKLLAKEVNKEAAANNGYNENYEIRYNKPAYQATYRLLVTLKLAIFELFGRETSENKRDSNSLINLYSGTRSILWEIQEGTNIKFIPFLAGKFSGMQYYFTNENIRREFTNYLKSYSRGLFGIGATYTYYKEEDYDPGSIEYIINTSGYNESEKDKLKEFNFIVDANNQGKRISKKEYILMTIKEGGYSKFMKLNNKSKGSSSWSGSDKIDFSKLN